MTTSTVSTLRKFASWIPAVGFFVEVLCVLGTGVNYLSSKRNAVRYYGSAAYHAVSICTVIAALLIAVMS